jgi:hypothetical protein
MDKAASESKGDVMESAADFPEGLQRHKGGSPKVSASGGECDGGTKDRELGSKASSIYTKAVRNGG